MPLSTEWLGHRVCQLEVGLDVLDADPPKLDPVLDVVVVDVNMLGPVRFCLSGGPFDTTTVILIYPYVICVLIIEGYIKL